LGSPNDSNLHTTQCLAEYRAGRRAESIAAAERSIALTKGLDASNWYVLAMARWQKGDKDEARKWFDKAVAWAKQDPQNVELRQFWSEAAQLLGVPGPG
jgi:Flp pilus assembly protein TadD